MRRGQRHPVSVFSRQARPVRCGHVRGHRAPARGARGRRRHERARGAQDPGHRARGGDAGGPAGPGAGAAGMRSLPRLVPLGVLALVMPDLALAEGPTRKTLAECIAIALAQQPTLKAASASVEAARERVWESTAAYLPQVGALYSAARRHASNGSLTGSNFGGARASTFDFYSTGVALSQVLFDFGQNLSLFNGGLTTAQVGEAKANLLASLERATAHPFSAE